MASSEKPLAQGVRELGAPGQFFVVHVNVNEADERRLVIRTSPPPHTEEFVLKLPAQALLDALVALRQVDAPRGGALDADSLERVALWCLDHVRLVETSDADATGRPVRQLTLAGLDQDAHVMQSLMSVFELDRVFKDRGRAGLTYHDRRHLQARHEEMDMAREQAQQEREAARKEAMAAEMAERARLEEQNRLEREERISAEKKAREEELRELRKREEAMLAAIERNGAAREQAILDIEARRAEKHTTEILDRKREIDAEEEQQQHAINMSRAKMAAAEERRLAELRAAKERNAELETKRAVGHQAKDESTRAKHEQYVSDVKQAQQTAEEARAAAEAAKQAELERKRAERAEAIRQNVVKQLSDERLDDTRAVAEGQRADLRRLSAAEHAMQLKQAKAEQDAAVQRARDDELAQRQRKYEEKLAEQKALEEKQRALNELRDRNFKETLDVRASRDESIAAAVEEHRIEQRNVYIQRRRQAEEARLRAEEELVQQRRQADATAASWERQELLRAQVADTRTKERNLRELEHRDALLAAEQQKQAEKEAREALRRQQLKEEQEFVLRQSEERRHRHEMLERSRAEKAAERDRQRLQRELARLEKAH